MRIFNFIFYSFFTLIILGIAGLFVMPLLPIDKTIDIKIVESGSMEPTILTGSLVIVAPATKYVIGDVITFDSASADIPTTHRIIDARTDNGETYFMTKGDANEEADSNEVNNRSVIGKVVVDIPYAGFILDFSRQPIGFLFLIVLPALMIILGEIEKIWKEVRRRKTVPVEKVETILPTEKTSSDVTVPVYKMIEIACPVYKQSNHVSFADVVSTSQTKKFVIPGYFLPILVVLGSILFTAMSFTGSTLSYLTDSESLLGNLMRASAIDFSVETDGGEFLLDPEVTADEAAVVVEVTAEKVSAALIYDVRIEYVSGNPAFCDTLLVETTLPYIYTGSLMGLTAAGTMFNDPWELTVTIDPAAASYLPGDTCVLNLVFKAIRTGASSESGYVDVEMTTLKFATPISVQSLAQPFNEEVIDNETANETITELPVSPDIPAEETIEDPEPLVETDADKPVEDEQIINLTTEAEIQTEETESI